MCSLPMEMPNMAVALGLSAGLPFPLLFSRSQGCSFRPVRIWTRPVLFLPGFRSRFLRSGTRLRLFRYTGGRRFPVMVLVSAQHGIGTKGRVEESRSVGPVRRHWWPEGQKGGACPLATGSGCIDNIGFSSAVDPVGNLAVVISGFGGGMECDATFGIVAHAPDT